MRVAPPSPKGGGGKNTKLTLLLPQPSPFMCVSPSSPPLFRRVLLEQMLDFPTMLRLDSRIIMEELEALGLRSSVDSVAFEVGGSHSLVLGAFWQPLACHAGEMGRGAGSVTKTGSFRSFGLIISGRVDGNSKSSDLISAPFTPTLNFFFFLLFG